MICVSCGQETKGTDLCEPECAVKVEGSTLWEPKWAPVGGGKFLLSTEDRLALRNAPPPPNRYGWCVFLASEKTVPAEANARWVSLNDTDEMIRQGSS